MLKLLELTVYQSTSVGGVLAQGITADKGPSVSSRNARVRHVQCVSQGVKYSCEITGSPATLVCSECPVYFATYDAWPAVMGCFGSATHLTPFAGEHEAQESIIWAHVCMSRSTSTLLAFYFQKKGLAHSWQVCYTFIYIYIYFPIYIYIYMYYIYILYIYICIKHRVCVCCLFTHVKM